MPRFGSGTGVPPVKLAGDSSCDKIEPSVNTHRQDADATVRQWHGRPAREGCGRFKLRQN
jgi:hypothetical protein